MEKNCTNCKFNIPVEGMSYSGFCTDDFQCGNITSEDTVCSRYRAKELPEKGLKNTIDNMQETIEGLKCCTSGADGCKTCPFARYECTCQQDLKFAALQLLCKQKSYIEALERMVGGYATDQEIWLARNDALEKEIEELKEQKAYYWEKADTLAEDYRQLKRDAEVTEINLGEALQTITQLTKSNEELWNSYHQGYSVGYEYGKQDALSADRAEPSKERPEVEG
jgi:hypothetical protein